MIITKSCVWFFVADMPSLQQQFEPNSQQALPLIWNGTSEVLKSFND